MAVNCRRFGLIATDLVPVHGSSHDSYEDFGDVRLIRECETQRVLSEFWNLLGDIAHQLTQVGVVFTANSGVGKHNYG